MDATRQALSGLLNIVQAAQDWGVHRLGVARTIGVYGGLTSAGPLREDTPLLMTSGHLIPAFKKIGELLDEQWTRGSTTSRPKTGSGPCAGTTG